MHPLFGRGLPLSSNDIHSSHGLRTTDSGLETWTIDAKENYSGEGGYIAFRMRILQEEG